MPRTLRNLPISVSVAAALLPRGPYLSLQTQRSSFDTLLETKRAGPSIFACCMPSFSFLSCVFNRYSLLSFDVCNSTSTLPQLVTACFAESTNPIIAYLFSEEAPTAKPKSICSEFRRSITSLEAVLSDAPLSFVIALQPAVRSSCVWEADYVCDQLASCGVVQGLGVRAEGYPLSKPIQYVP